LSVKDSKWAWDSRPEDGGEPREVYIGDSEEWDPAETMKRQWTKPIIPGAEKAVHSKECKAEWMPPRYLCCHDPTCQVPCQVKQGPINAWHFSRQWKSGYKSKHPHKCKHERMYRGGESIFHRTTKKAIARMLTPGKTLDGKTIAEKASLEVSRNFRLSNGEDVRLKPDVYVKFTDSTWFAIEVVYSHEPERNAHEAYGKSMVVLDLKGRRVVDDEFSFVKWVREGGIKQALDEESREEKRVQRYEARNQLYAEKREKEKYIEDFENELSRCRKKYGLMNLTPPMHTPVNEIEQLFENVREARKKEYKPIIRPIQPLNRGGVFTDRAERHLESLSNPETGQTLAEKRNEAFDAKQKQEQRQRERKIVRRQRKRKQEEEERERQLKLEQKRKIEEEELEKLKAEEEFEHLLTGPTLRKSNQRQSKRFRKRRRKAKASLPLSIKKTRM
jgi:hypothetical protein